MALLKCIENIISFEPCEKPDRESGKLYLIDVPYITREFLEDLTNPDNATSIDVFQSALSFSTDMLMQKVKNSLNGFIQPFLQPKTYLCAPPDTSANNYTFLTPSFDAGIQVDFVNAPQGALLCIDTVQVYSDSPSGFYSLFVKDGSLPPDEYLIEVVQGCYHENILNHRLQPYSKNVKLYFEAGSISLGRYAECLPDTKGCGPCGTKGRAAEQPSAYAIASGYQAIGENKQVYGLQVSASVKCDPSDLICCYAEDMAHVLRMYVAAQLMASACLNNNLNITTLADLEQKQKVAESFKEQADNLCEALEERIQDYVRQYPTPCYRCNNRSGAWVKR